MTSGIDMPSTSGPQPGTMSVRDRARTAMKTELAVLGQELFRSKGYEATTVDDLAAAAGMSRRTFFRYFDSKEDLVLGKYDLLADAVEVGLRARPLDEPVWEALRRSFDTVVTHFDAPGNAERALALGRIVEGNAVLTAGELERLSRIQHRLIGVLAERAQGPADGTDPRTAALVAAAVACLKVAQAAWTAADGRARLADVLDDAMSALIPAEG